TRHAELTDWQYAQSHSPEEVKTSAAPASAPGRVLKRMFKFGNTFQCSEVDDFQLLVGHSHNVLPGKAPQKVIDGLPGDPHHHRKLFLGNFQRVAAAALTLTVAL